MISLGDNGSSKSTPDRHRWLISYADFMTLLCAFFIMMYSVQLLDNEQYQAVQDTLGGMFTANSAKEMQISDASSLLDSNNGLLPLFETVKQQLQVYIDGNQVELEQEGEWVKVRLSSDELFSGNGWELNSAMEPVVKKLALAVRPVPNAINVEAHTDDVPVSSQRIASNWDLSVLRAVAIVRAFESYGVAPQRMAATGFGYHKPLSANNTNANRQKNRRIEILIKQGSPNQAWSRENTTK